MIWKPRVIYQEFSRLLICDCLDVAPGTEDLRHRGDLQGRHVSKASLNVYGPMIMTLRLRASFKQSLERPLWTGKPNNVCIDMFVESDVWPRFKRIIPKFWRASGASHLGKSAFFHFQSIFLRLFWISMNLSYDLVPRQEDKHRNYEVFFFIQNAFLR